ncbi:MAG: hypothetical protein ACQETQ_06915 [Spirochaetota bacterium]
MQVLINQKQVDVELESESTLGEVMEGIRGWLNESQLYITDVVVDDEGVQLDTPHTWEQTNVDNVGTIEIRALPAWEVRSNGLGILAQYFSLLHEAVEQRDESRLSQLAAEAETISTSLPTYAQDLVDAEKRDDPLFRVVDAPEIREGRLPEDERRSRLLTYLEQAVTLLKSRAREIEEPFQEAGATAQMLRGLIPEMNDVSVVLQRGDDGRAMDMIVRFTELVAKLLRVMPNVVRVDAEPRLSREQLERYGSELNATLEELVGAFNAQDSVLIGDLVEYELVPKIEELLEHVPEPKGSESS